MKFSKTVILLLLLLFFDFFLTSWHFIQTNRYSGSYQGDALISSLAFSEGNFEYDGIYHPMYSMVLSTFSERNIRFFTNAKMFSLFVLLLTLLLFYYFSTQMFGGAIGWLGLFWMASNWVVLALSFQLRAEVLFLGFFMLTWFFSIKGFSNPTYFIAAGVFAGLAYLTKATGQLLAASIVLSSLFIWKKEWRQYRKLLFFIGGYAFVAIFLWIVNAKMFGDPFYNWAIRHAMWLDQWSDLKTITELPTFSLFLKENGIFGVLSRMASGFIDFFPVLISIFLPNKLFFVQSWFIYPWLVFVGVGLFIGLIRKNMRTVFLHEFNENRVFWSVSLTVGIVFTLMFSWYHQISSSERFVMGIIPMGLCMGGRVTMVIWKKVFDSSKLKKYKDQTQLIGSTALLGLLMLGVVVKVNSFDFGNPYQTDKLDPWVEDVMQYTTTLSPHSKLAVDSMDLLPLWLIPQKEKNVVIIPRVDSAGEWNDFLQKSHVQYLLIADRDQFMHGKYLKTFFGINVMDRLDQIKPLTQFKRGPLKLEPDAYFFTLNSGS